MPLRACRDAYKHVAWAFRGFCGGRFEGLRGSARRFWSRRSNRQTRKAGSTTRPRFGNAWPILRDDSRHAAATRIRDGLRRRAVDLDRLDVATEILSRERIAFRFELFREVPVDGLVRLPEDGVRRQQLMMKAHR